MGQIENHVLTIDNRKAISLSGAADVLSFNEREIRFSLIGGGKVVVGRKSQYRRVFQADRRSEIVGYDKLGKIFYYRSAVA